MSALLEDIATLGEIGANGAGVTRLAWSPELEQAVEWCGNRMEAAGLDVERDAAGNLIGHWPAGEGRAVLAGSHLDTVPSGGRYDGALGVLAAIDAVRRLKRQGFEPSRPVWVAAFMDEEGVRFGTSMLGSRAFAGEDVGPLDDRQDSDGVPLGAAMRACGWQVAELKTASRIDEVGAYLELHIEQGPRLERAGADLGVVTEITGLLGLRVRLTGSARHAGTTPMDARRDALVGASRLVVELRDAARSREGLVATVGFVTVQPGAGNVVPGEARLSVDVRASDDSALVQGGRLVRELLARIAAEERLDAEITEAFRHPPRRMDPAVVDVLEAAARQVGATPVRLASGAGHDAMVIGRHVPAGMLFVPSSDGISHAPEEFTDGRLCELGAAALADAIRRLSASDDLVASEEES